MSRDGFNRFSRRVSALAGRPITFLLAAAGICVWAACGPIADYSDTWQLVINTSTTVLTFLMVFLIHNAQTRDAAAIQLKLDELIRSVRSARNDLLDLEDLDDAALDAMHRRYAELAARARRDRVAVPAQRFPAGAGRRDRPANAAQERHAPRPFVEKGCAPCAAVSRGRAARTRRACARPS